MENSTAIRETHSLSMAFSPFSQLELTLPIFQGMGRRQQPLTLPTRQPLPKLLDWKTNRLLVITYPN
jgi:hypothetical protein